MGEPIVITYLIYLAISIALTVWVANTLYRNGKLFLIDVFRGNEGLAASVNHLLVVGFYLVNLGFISLALESRDQVAGARHSIELLSWKVGLVLVVLGFMHLFNVYLFSSIRRKALERERERERFVARPTAPQATQAWHDPAPAQS